MMKISGGNQSWQDARTQIIAPGYSSTTTCYVESAQGAIIRDVEGKEYIDFAGGIAVMNVGHSHPKVVAAMKAQAEKFTHTCFMVAPYDAPVRLAQRLVAITPGKFAKKVVFINSGAEAVENAAKIARYYTKRPAILVFENGYHGRTLDDEYDEQGEALQVWVRTIRSRGLPNAIRRCRRAGKASRTFSSRT